MSRGTTALPAERKCDERCLGVFGCVPHEHSAESRYSTQKIPLLWIRGVCGHADGTNSSIGASQPANSVAAQRHRPPARLATGLGKERLLHAVDQQLLDAAVVDPRSQRP
jgi:hypothetical protein